MHIDIRVFLKILGILTLIEGISMLLCTPAAVYYKECEAIRNITRGTLGDFS